MAAGCGGRIRARTACEQATSAGQYSPDSAESRVGAQFSASQQNTDLGGIKAVFDTALNQQLGLTYGIEYKNDQFDANQMTFDQAISDASGAPTLRRERVQPRYPGFTVDAIAGFGQLAWDVTEELKLIAGISQQYTD